MLLAQASDLQQLPTSRRCAARSPYPSKTCRWGIERPFVYCCNDIVATSVPIDVPDACASCHASPLHYQGLDSAQPFGYQPPPGRVPAPFTLPAAGPPPANAYGHGASRRSNHDGRRRGRRPAREAAALRKAARRTVLSGTSLD